MNTPGIIFKNTVAQTAANLITRFSNILITFVMARTLHATGVGIYATAVAYFSLIDEATNMGASTFLIREIAKEPSRTSQYVINFSAVGSVLAAVGLAIFWTILPHLGYSTEMTTSLYIIALAIIPGTFNAVQNSVFVAHQRVEFVTYTMLLSSIVTVAGSLYLLLRGYGVISLVILFVVVQYLITLFYFYFINRYIVALRWQFEPRFAVQLLWDIRTFAALSILAGLQVQPEVIILSLLGTEAQVGYYSAALKVAYLWLFISSIYMNNVYPVLSRSFYREDRQFQLIQDKSIKYLLAISLPLSIGLIAVAAPIVNLLYGPGFEGAIVPLQLLSLGLPLAFVGAVLWRALTARDLQNKVLLVRMITLVSRLGGGLLLIGWFYEIGASLSATISLLLTMILLAFYMWRDGLELGLLKLGWRFTLAAMGMGVLVWIGNLWLSIWILIPVAILTYLVLVVAFKAFSSEDYAIFRQIRNPRPAEKS